LNQYASSNAKTIISICCAVERLLRNPACEALNMHCLSALSAMANVTMRVQTL
jgi:hypothetical protein